MDNGTTGAAGANGAIANGSHPLVRGVAPDQSIIAERILNAEPRPGAPDPKALAGELLNDLGNGRRLRQRFGGDIAFAEQMGWLAWDGMRWSADGGDAHAMIRAQQTAEAIFEEAETFEYFGEPEPDPEDKKACAEWLKRRSKHLAPIAALREHALASGNEARCKAMLSSAAPHLRVPVENLDADPWQLNVRNGTIDLQRGRACFPHQRSQWITKLANVEHDIEAECPRWEQFIAEVLPDRAGEGVARFVQKWLGYSLCGDMSEQKIVVLEGKGANGKSTLMEVIARILGDYAVTTPIETFLHQDKRSGGSGPSPDIARLKGARLVRASEPEPGARLSESTIKQWTGGEKMTARHMYREFFEFAPAGKLTLAVNIRPVLVGKDHGIRRRILIVPFKQLFEAGKMRGGALISKLLTEAPGILNWLLEGFAYWLEEGLEPPQAVIEATESYFVEMDPIGAFIAEAVTQTNSRDDKVAATAMRAAYGRWCTHYSEDEKSVTAFGRRLTDLGIKRYTSMGRVFYLGCILDQAWQPESTPGTYGERD